MLCFKTKIAKRTALVIVISVAVIILAAIIFWPSSGPGGFWGKLKPVIKDYSPPPEIWCLGIVLDVPVPEDLAKVQNNMDRLKDFIDENTDKERTFKTIKAVEIDPAPELKSFYAVNRGTSEDIKDYFMSEGYSFLNFSGGLEFGSNKTNDYMKQRLSQLMDEQTSCDKAYIYELSNDLSDNFVGEFKIR